MNSKLKEIKDIHRKVKVNKDNDLSLSVNQLKRLILLSKKTALIFKNLSLREGQSLIEISNEILKLSRGLSYGTLEVGFPGICCISKASTICHGIPDNRLIEIDDLIKIDIVTKKGGMYSDTCGTFLIGTQHRSLGERSYLCFSKILFFLSSSKTQTGKDLSNFGRNVSKDLDLSIVKEFVGHGIGKQMHQEPIVTFDSKNTNRILFNQPFTIEPIFYARNNKYQILEHDGHEYQDSKGNFFVTFEHTVVKTRLGFHVLTYNPLDKKLDLLKRFYRWNQYSL